MDVELKEGLDKIQAKIDKFQEKYDKELESAGSAAAETKSALSKAMQEYQDEMKKIYGIQQSQLDKIEKEYKDFRETGQRGRPVDIKSAFQEMLKSSEDFQRVKKERSGKAFMELKDTMTTSDNYTGQVDGFTRNETIMGQILRTTHIRELFPQGTMSGSHYELIRNTGGSGGPTYVAEAGPKPNQEENFQLFQIPAAKIAAEATLSDEMLADTAGLASFMATKMMGDLKRLEDQKILYGVGSGDITGISQLTSVTDINENSFSPEVFGSASTQQALINAKNVMENANTPVRAFLVSPTTANSMLMSIVTGSADVALRYSYDGSMLYIAGVPLIQSTAVSGDDVFVINPEYAVIFQREGISVRTSTEHASNFTSNLTTMLIEERLAFVPWREEAFGYGDVTAIKAALATT